MKKKTTTKKKPITQPAPASPPMIRLRLPSEKPTMEDADANGCIAVFWENGQHDIRRWDHPFHHEIKAWLGRLPEGILPREPSQEEKWRAEAALAYSKLPEATRPNKPGFIDGFLAAKKGGAE